MKPTPLEREVLREVLASGGFDPKLADGCEMVDVPRLPMWKHEAAEMVMQAAGLSAIVLHPSPRPTDEFS